MYPNRFMIRLTKEIVTGKHNMLRAPTAKVSAHEWSLNVCTSHTRGERKTQRRHGAGLAITHKSAGPVSSDGRPMPQTLGIGIPVR